MFSFFLRIKYTKYSVYVLYTPYCTVKAGQIEEPISCCYLTRKIGFPLHSTLFVAQSLAKCKADTQKIINKQKMC